MTRRLVVALVAAVLTLPAAAGAQEAKGIDLGQLRSGRSPFPAVWQPYRPAALPPVDLQDGAQLDRLAAGGTLSLSLTQFLQLVVENDLTLEAARYNTAIAEVDVLRARSGQAARGVATAPLPGAVFAGAIGAGVSTTAALSSGGTGGAAISTQGKLVSFGARGIFDPTFQVNLSYDHLTNPLNTTKVAGASSLVIPTTVLQTRYQQELPIGTSYSVSFNLQRQASTQGGLLFDPALSSFGALQIYQPLLNGFGRAFTQRFITLAQNNTHIVHEGFHGTLNDRLSTAANAYWDLVALRENLRLAREAVEAAQREHDEDLERVDVGVMTPLDAVISESQVASARVQLIRAETAYRQQEVVVKAFISKDLAARLGNMPIEATESLTSVGGTALPPVATSIARALERRSSIHQAELTVDNQKIAEQYTRKNLLPTLSAYVAFEMYGLAPGTSPAVRELIHWNYPEYAFGFSWSLPVLNRAAQADDVRARLETQQSEAQLQRTRRQVTLQVQTSTAAIEQDRARVEAAERALAASRTAYAGETDRLQFGISTPYRVLQAQRDLTAAEAAAVQAQVNYAKAVVAYEVAVSSLLEDHGIDASAAERGSLWHE
ncbi:MAG TPA: TolC family protein [Vicinamibacterales bacterium]|nr:TolC family protein [Vicinamibacterales bacterium]